MSATGDIVETAKLPAAGRTGSLVGDQFSVTVPDVQQSAPGAAILVIVGSQFTGHRRTVGSPQLTVRIVGGPAIQTKIPGLVAPFDVAPGDPCDVTITQMSPHGIRGSARCVVSRTVKVAGAPSITYGYTVSGSFHVAP